jgi:hypothetical protein
VSRFKLGRLDARRPHGLADLETYSLGRLPKPPPEVEPPSVTDWGMFGNDVYGDCTIAGVVHLIMAWNAKEKGNSPIPTLEATEAQYLDLTGGEDTGLNEADVLSRWHSKGLFGNKAAAFAPIKPSQIVHLQQGIALFDGLYFGIACPESAQEDFPNKPWTYDPSSPIEGGHCIIGVGFDSQFVYCVSWGQLVKVTYPFLAHYLDEAWAIISQEAVENKGDALGIDIPSLQADLRLI